MHRLSGALWGPTGKCSPRKRHRTILKPRTVVEHERHAGSIQQISWGRGLSSPCPESCSGGVGQCWWGEQTHPWEGQQVPLSPHSRNEAPPPPLLSAGLLLVVPGELVMMIPQNVGLFGLPPASLSPTGPGTPRPALCHLACGPWDFSVKPRPRHSTSTCAQPRTSGRFVSVQNWNLLVSAGHAQRSTRAYAAALTWPMKVVGAGAGADRPVM